MKLTGKTITKTHTSDIVFNKITLDLDRNEFTMAVFQKGNGIDTGKITLVDSLAGYTGSEKNIIKDFLRFVRNSCLENAKSVTISPGDITDEM